MRIRSRRRPKKKSSTASHTISLLPLPMIFLPIPLPHSPRLPLTTPIIHQPHVQRMSPPPRPASSASPEISMPTGGAVRGVIG